MVWTIETKRKKDTITKRQFVSMFLLKGMSYSCVHLENSSVSPTALIPDVLSYEIRSANFDKEFDKLMIFYHF